MGYGGAAFKFAKKHNLIDGVKFISDIPFKKVKEEISNALIFLHPSREESFGMVVLEAMVFCTPVLGGKNSGDIPYLLNKGECGLLCDVNKLESLANSIKILMNDEYLCKKIREKAFNYVKDNFSEKKVINNYLKYLLNEI